MKDFKAIIAAGGKGTRLRPLTFSSNKHLIPIANQPLLMYPFKNIVALGIKEIGIIVNESKPEIEKIFGNGEKWGVKITYINQPDALGLAHVVKISEEFVGTSPFIYHLGDNIFTEGIEKPYKKFIEKEADALVTLVEHEENFRLGVPYFENEKLVKIVEKPKNPPNKFGIPGLYFFNSNVFKAFQGEDAIKPSERGELEITDLYNWMLRHEYKVEVSQLEGEWLDPGKFDDSLKANSFLLEKNCRRTISGKVDEKSEIIGNVEIHDNVTIKNSKITGPCSIASNCLIENCEIGKYAAIDENCRIINSKIENSIIMSEVTIENCPDKIVESMIGKKSTIHGINEKVAKLTIADQSIIEIG